MPTKNRVETKSALKDSAVPLSLQALQSGIDSLSLEDAFAAVKLAKLKIDDLREEQNIALSQVRSASVDVKEAELRFGFIFSAEPFCIISLSSDNFGLSQDMYDWW